MRAGSQGAGSQEEYQLAVPRPPPMVLQKEGQGRHQGGIQGQLRQVQGQAGNQEAGVRGRSGDINQYEIQSSDHQAGL